MMKIARTDVSFIKLIVDTYKWVAVTLQRHLPDTWSIDSFRNSLVTVINNVKYDQQPEDNSDWQC